MAKYKLEYIWLDGYEPVPNLRGKTRVGEYDAFPSLGELPLWGFDGSSTRQAEGHDSDRLLKPVAIYPDPAYENTALVMCEVLMPDGSPHPSNSRATIPDDPDTWFGFEQEYFLYQNGAPLGFPPVGFPEPQGEYYTGVGYRNVGSIAREIVYTHLDYCLAAGINHEGINAEVAKGQWEFQIFGKGSKKAADEVWMARYLLLRLCERYEVDVNCHRKPLGVEFDWNGSGMHTNFSTAHMREVGGKEYFEALMGAFDEHKEDAHRGLRARQPHAPDRAARDAGDRQVQLRARRPRRLDPHPAQLRQQRLQGLPRGSAPELRGRPVQDRRPDPGDDPHGGRRGRRGRDARGGRRLALAPLEREAALRPLAPRARVEAALAAAEPGAVERDAGAHARAAVRHELPGRKVGELARPRHVDGAGDPARRVVDVVRLAPPARLRARVDERQPRVGETARYLLRVDRVAAARGAA